MQRHCLQGSIPPGCARGRKCAASAATLGASLFSFGPSVCLHDQQRAQRVGVGSTTNHFAKAHLNEMTSAQAAEPCSSRPDGGDCEDVALVQGLVRDLDTPDPDVAPAWPGGGGAPQVGRGRAAARGSEWWWGPPRCSTNIAPRGWKLSAQAACAHLPVFGAGVQCSFPMLLGSRRLTLSFSA
jgi:hypothetical protein